jgi:hypothetical protein
MMESLYPRLSSLAIPPEVHAALIEPFKLDCERFSLARQGGNPWRTFQAERTAYHACFSGANLGYKVFKSLVLGLTLVLPPRRYYQLKQWYSTKGLRRYREKLGNAVPAQAVRVRSENVLLEN